MKNVNAIPEYKDLYDKITMNNEDRINKKYKKDLKIVLIFMSIIVISIVAGIIAGTSDAFAVSYMIVVFTFFVPLVYIFKLAFDSRRIELKSAPTKCFNKLCEEGHGEELRAQYEASVMIPVRYNYSVDIYPSKKEKKQGITIKWEEYNWRISKDYIFVKGYGVLTYDLFKWIYKKTTTTKVGVLGIPLTSLVVQVNPNPYGLNDMELSIQGKEDSVLFFISKIKEKNPNLLVGYTKENIKAAKK